MGVLKFLKRLTRHAGEPASSPTEQPRPWTITTEISSTPAPRQQHEPPPGAFRQYRIAYFNYYDRASTRDIYMLSIDESDADLFRAWCFDAGDRRKFRFSRIQSAVHVATGKAVTDLARHYRSQA